MSHDMRKPDFCLCENKGTDQLRSYISASVFTTLVVQFLFHLNPKVQASSLHSCDCTGRFVPHLVGNPVDQFSRVVAHIYISCYKMEIFTYHQET